MSADLSDQIESVVEWLIRVASGLGFILPIAIFALVNLFNRDKKKGQATRPPGGPQPRRREAAPPPLRPAPEAMPFPLDTSMWMEPEPPRPSPRPQRSARDDAYRHDDDALRWGSAFEANDREKAGSALKWGSVFDEERERTKWGWPETEWGGDFASKRGSEPKITVG